MPIMYKKNIIPLFAAAAAALIVGSATAAYILMSSSSADTALAPPLRFEDSVPVVQATSTLPARLIIPSLSIDARVQHVGRTAAGLMGDPSNFTDVAWYKNGPAPGQEGSAVIGGHLDNALALNGVFKHLSDLKVGQEVEVQTAVGKMLHFRVTRTEIYPYDKVPLNELFTKTGGAYLNLVTCNGTWLPKQRTYDHRLVVYTELAQ